MNRGYAAYKSTIQATETDRGREQRAFALVTGKLDQAATLAGDPDPANVSRVQDALQHNLRLWGVVREACLDEANALPLELRRGLVRLARFTESSTSALTGGTGDREIIAVLVEINRNVMAGLSPAPV